MQATPDKDFDSFFQQKFDAFEIEPSAKLWGNISASLDKKPKAVKKNSSVFWMAAASVLVVLGASFYSTNAPTMMKLHGKIEQTPQPVNVAANKRVTKPEENFVTAKPIETTAQYPKKVEQLKVYRDTRIAYVPAVNSQSKLKITENTPDVVLPEAAQVSNQLNDKEITTFKPNTIMSLSAQPEKKSKPVLAVIATTNEILISDEQPSKRRIRSMGDLVNLVVSKIDPRSEKIIEFKDDEDNGAEVTGINLGLFKYISKKHETRTVNVTNR